MNRANSLLLKEYFNGKPLFSSQIELVRDLISLKGSPYYTPATDLVKHQKEFVRLKTFISQLLSTTVSRTVTEDFKTGLMVAVKNRLMDEKMAAKLVNMVIADLKQRKTVTPKSEQRSTPLDQFFTDVQSANYIAVITMRPLQVDLPSEGAFSIRHFLFRDLIERLTDREKDLRQYRFNFPTDAHSQLFWRGFRRIFIQWLSNNLTAPMLEVLYEKFTIKAETQMILNEKKTYSTADCEALTDETLESLNHNRYLMVFTSSAPIFSLPMVVLDPTEQNNAKVYTVFENDKGSPLVLKYPESDVGLWRIFMWDQFKLQRNLTKEKTFAESISA